MRDIEFLPSVMPFSFPATETVVERVEVEVAGPTRIVHIPMTVEVPVEVEGPVRYVDVEVPVEVPIPVVTHSPTLAVVAAVLFILWMLTVLFAVVLH